MKFGSLFTGVGGFDLGLERAGMECIWQCEIDKYCNQILEEHWKGVRRYNDVKEITRENAEVPDLIVGGFPCQDLSVAGKRAGLSGERSGLWFEFERIIGELRPRWVIIENVPGLLSSNKGADFAIILKALDEFGYGVAWRILDSQYFGVAQRRRRVFIVASLGNTSCAEVLFESESVPWNIESGGEEGQETTRTTVSSLEQRGYKGINSDNLDHMIPSYWDGGQVTDTLDSSSLMKGQMMPEKRRFPAVWQMNHASEVYRECWSGQNRLEFDKPISPTLQERMGTGGNNVPLVGVRRLTPVECCRLQGFPDDWNSSVSDTQRYKQMGNAVTVNVIEWIGNRIIKFDSPDPKVV